MSDSSLPPVNRDTAPQPGHHPDRDRRHNSRLRELVDEMMATVRAASNRDLWTPEERARCEADMARIMDHVRTQALNGAASRAHLD